MKCNFFTLVSGKPQNFHTQSSGRQACYGMADIRHYWLVSDTFFVVIVIVKLIIASFLSDSQASACKHKKLCERENYSKEIPRHKYIQMTLICTLSLYDVCRKSRTSTSIAHQWRWCSFIPQFSPTSMCLLSEILCVY